MRDTTASRGADWSRLAMGGFALCLLLYAAILVRWPDNFFADDSYFYFQIASNMAHGLGSTFNTVMPTNGYHPLWMLVCAAVFTVVPAKAAAVHAIGFVIALCDAATLLLLSSLLGKVAPGYAWAAWFLYLPFCFLTQLGTEGALSGLLLAAFAGAAQALCSSPSNRRSAMFILAGTFAVLGRLDNIFIVVCAQTAMLLFAPRPVRKPIRILVLRWSPLYPLFWGGYLASNWHWFGTLQPISGLLKGRPGAGGRELHAPTHIALLALAIIVPGILFLARRRGDTFFRVVELPFALGVIAHGAYIAAFMSSETRWSWYYTSWVLLAAVLLSRSLNAALADRGPLPAPALAMSAAALLLLVWYFVDCRRNAHNDPDAVADGYRQNLSDRLRLHTVVTFDKPGRMAYYTDVHVVALDGLTGSIDFQHELASRGIAAFDAEHQVDAFVGPPQPLDSQQRSLLCDRTYLSSTRFHCQADELGQWYTDRVEVLSRLTGQSAGTLALPRTNMVWNAPGQVAVWRLGP